MTKHTRHFRFDEFTVLEVFLGVALFGLIAGAVFSTIFPELTVSAPAPVVVAPTSDAYRAEAGEIMAPFFRQASAMGEADFGKADAELHALAAKSQELMLRVRVPADSRDIHLSVVLLLDGWKRALSGDAAAAVTAMQKTDELLLEHPWLVNQL